MLVRFCHDDTCDEAKISKQRLAEIAVVNGVRSVGGGSQETTSSHSHWSLNILKCLLVLFRHPKLVESRNRASTFNFLTGRNLSVTLPLTAGKDMMMEEGEEHKHTTSGQRLLEKGFQCDTRSVIRSRQRMQNVSFVTVSFLPAQLKVLMFSPDAALMAQTNN